MIEEVGVSAYGRQASEALARVIDTVKMRRPLAPVTVIAPSNFAALAARRLLGAGCVGAATGVANVTFMTPVRFASLLATGCLEDSHPLTNPVLGAAVRRVLAVETGPLRHVAAHVATEAALAALYSELSRVSERARDRLAAGGGRAAEAVRIYAAVQAELSGFHGEADVARAAAARADLDAALKPFGHVIWYLPEPLPYALSRFVARVLETVPSTVLVALAGTAEADDAVLKTCREAGVDVDPGAGAGIDVPVAPHVVSVTDADEEVRAVVRRIAALAEAGTRLDRIGIFYPRADPYVRIVRRQLASAGIPAHGPSPERLADSAAGRTLLAALALPHQCWRRDRVMALVSAAPVRNGEGSTRPATWEDLSRRAGVVRDLADWRRKLTAHVHRIDAELAARISEKEDPDANRTGWETRLTREKADTETLSRFVEDLAAAVADVEAARGWVAKSDAARRLLDRLTGGDHARRSWPDAEQDFADRVEAALARLATLEVIDPDPTEDVFRRALAAELDVARGRAGRYGEGVMYGLLTTAVGEDLDAVFVLGMAEGDCPAPRRDDALLPDRVRDLTGGELALRREGLDEQHRAFLAALAAAPAGRRHLTFPRGDLRGGRRRLPSRWLLDSVSALAGVRVHSTEFADIGAPFVEVVPSYAAGLLHAAAAADMIDRDLAALSRHTVTGCDVRTHPVAAGIGRGLDCLAARSSAEFTEWDGNVAGLPVPSPARGDLQSATRLERWAACGFRYFLSDVLHLDERDDPARIVELSPLDRGSGVHKTLERFFAEVIAAGPPDPDEPWSPQQRARLREIAVEVLEDYERSGRTGRKVNWRLVRDRILLTVDAFLSADEAWRGEARARPVRVELPFGLDGAEPVTVTLGGGRRVRFRGRADRVDVTEDGRHVVFDYKTGSGRQYKGIGDVGADPVKAGTALQLGLYSEAARILLGADAASAYYWMVDAEGAAKYGYDWDDPCRARFVEAVTAIVDGIESGAFPMNPGDWQIWWRTHDNCRYCGFDDVCLRARGEQADAKRGAAALAVRRVLDGDAEAGI